MAVRRLSNRWTCPACKRTYNMEFKPPANDRVCDIDGTELERRSDDDELTVRRRLALYREQTAPLEAFYRERKLLVRDRRRGGRGRGRASHERRAGGRVDDHQQVPRGARPDAPSRPHRGRHDLAGARGRRARASPPPTSTPWPSDYIGAAGRDARPSWATGAPIRRRSAPRSTTRSCTASRRPARRAGGGHLLSLDFGAIWEGFHARLGGDRLRRRRRAQRGRRAPA